MRRYLSILLLVILAGPALAQEARLPILVPITGFLSLEGTSQRNGALLALRDADRPVDAPVVDTGTTPEGAVTALARVLADGTPRAVAASMLGTQMLAMIPPANDAGVPLITVSGTAAVTEQGSPWVFRFFPSDAVVKRAQARHVVESVGAQRPAIIYQTTAYGQSGRRHLAETLTELGAAPVLEEGLAVDVKDMLPAITRAVDAGADALVLQLHSAPTALFIRQARNMGVDLPIIAGSAMHQPATAALLEPWELENVCAESGSSPVSPQGPELADWVARYRAAFDAAPDAFALGQYDGMSMVLAALADGADSPEAVRDWLASHTYEGLAMTYRDDGRGNMAHDAVILCYDGADRIPDIAAIYRAKD